MISDDVAEAMALNFTGVHLWSIFMSYASIAIVDYAFLKAYSKT